jgi:hypothetical protein
MNEPKITEVMFDGAGIKEANLTSAGIHEANFRRLTKEEADFFGGIVAHMQAMFAAQDEYFSQRPILAGLRKLGILPDPYMPARLYALEKVGRAFQDTPEPPSV